MFSTRRSRTSESISAVRMTGVTDLTPDTPAATGGDTSPQSPTAATLETSTKETQDEVHKPKPTTPSTATDSLDSATKEPAWHEMTDQLPSEDQTVVNASYHVVTTSDKHSIDATVMISSPMVAGDSGTGPDDTTTSLTPSDLSDVPDSLHTGGSHVASDENPDSESTTVAPTSLPVTTNVTPLVAQNQINQINVADESLGELSTEDQNIITAPGGEDVDDINPVSSGDTTNGVDIVPSLVTGDEAQPEPNDPPDSSAHTDLSDTSDSLISGGSPNVSPESPTIEPMATVPASNDAVVTTETTFIGAGDDSETTGRLVVDQPQGKSAMTDGNQPISIVTDDPVTESPIAALQLIDHSKGASTMADVPVDPFLGSEQLISTPRSETSDQISAGNETIIISNGDENMGDIDHAPVDNITDDVAVVPLLVTGYESQTGPNDLPDIVTHIDLPDEPDSQLSNGSPTESTESPISKPVSTVSASNAAVTTETFAGAVDITETTTTALPMNDQSQEVSVMADEVQLPIPPVTDELVTDSSTTVQLVDNTNDVTVVPSLVTGGEAQPESNDPPDSLAHTDLSDGPDSPISNGYPKVPTESPDIEPMSTVSTSNAAINAETFAGAADISETTPTALPMTDQSQQVSEITDEHQLAIHSVKDESATESPTTGLHLADQSEVTSSMADVPAEPFLSNEQLISTPGEMSDQKSSGKEAIIISPGDENMGDINTVPADNKTDDVAIGHMLVTGGETQTGPNDLTNSEAHIDLSGGPDDSLSNDSPAVSTESPISESMSTVSASNADNNDVTVVPLLVTRGEAQPEPNDPLDSSAHTDLSDGPDGLLSYGSPQIPTESPNIEPMATVSASGEVLHMETAFVGSADVPEGESGVTNEHQQAIHSVTDESATESPTTGLQLEDQSEVASLRADVTAEPVLSNGQLISTPGEMSDQISSGKEAIIISPGDENMGEINTAPADNKTDDVAIGPILVTGGETQTGPNDPPNSAAHIDLSGGPKDSLSNDSPAVSTESPISEPMSTVSASNADNNDVTVVPLLVTRGEAQPEPNDPLDSSAHTDSSDGPDGLLSNGSPPVPTESPNIEPVATVPASDEVLPMETAFVGSADVPEGESGITNEHQLAIHSVTDESATESPTTGLQLEDQSEVASSRADVPAEPFLSNGQLISTPREMSDQISSGKEAIIISPGDENMGDINTVPADNKTDDVAIGPMLVTGGESQTGPNDLSNSVAHVDLSGGPDDPFSNDSTAVSTESPNSEPMSTVPASNAVVTTETFAGVADITETTTTAPPMTDQSQEVSVMADEVQPPIPSVTDEPATDNSTAGLQLANEPQVESAMPGAHIESFGGNEQLISTPTETSDQIPIGDQTVITPVGDEYVGDIIPGVGDDDHLGSTAEEVPDDNSASYHESSGDGVVVPLVLATGEPRPASNATTDGRVNNLMQIFSFLCCRRFFFLLFLFPWCHDVLSRNYWGLVTNVNGLRHNCIRKWLVTCSAPCYYRNQWLPTVNCTIKNNTVWNLSQSI